MKKLFLIAFVCILSLDAWAGIKRAVEPGASVSSDVGNLNGNMNFNSRKSSCTGYSLTSCSSNQVPVDFCPSDSRYFKECYHMDVFKFDGTNCRELSGINWQGKWSKCLNEY